MVSLKTACIDLTYLLADAFVIWCAVLVYPVEHCIIMALDLLVMSIAVSFMTDINMG